MSGFFQGVRDVRAIRPLGFVGEFIRSHDFRSVTGINSDRQAKQVVTVKVDTATDGLEYTFEVDGVEVSYTATAADKAVIAAGIADAVNATPGARRVAEAEADGVDTVTITGVWPGVAFEVSGASAELTATTVTAAATADAVDFGRAVIATGQVTDEGVPTVAVPTVANFDAQVQTHTIASAASAFFQAQVRVNGKTYTSAPVAHNTDSSTTATDLATAINAVMPANTVVATTDGADLVLTAEVPGAEFDADILSSGAEAATASKALTTGPSPATSLARALLGVSVRRLDVEAATVGGPGQYAANQGVEVATRGIGIVQRDTAEAWARGDEVFVSVAEATKGRFYNSAGANRVWLGRSPLVIERSEHSTTSDGVGVVRIDMGA